MVWVKVETRGTMLAEILVGELLQQVARGVWVKRRGAPARGLHVG